MSTTTSNLGLFKYDTINDAQTPFNITTALNNNWDILDNAISSSSGVTTYISGSTWYRIWNDGWKEQGGEVSLAETERTWTQPTLGDYGTLGVDNFACTDNAHTTQGQGWKVFNKGTGAWNTTNVLPNYIIWYTKTPIKITQLDLTNATKAEYTYTEAPRSGNVYGSNTNGDWILLTGWTSSNNTAGGVYNIDLSTNTEFYNYYKFEVTSGGGSYNYTWVGELTIHAVYKTSVANSITFPTAFSDTNYSYTFANQDGGGMNAYVSNKTISGMTLTNTNSGSASWTACGY